MLIQPATRATEAPDLTAAPNPAEPTADLRHLLRRTAGCEHAAFLDLSPAERQECEERLVKAGAARQGAAGFNLDRHGAFSASKDQLPYLERRPRNGCKLRAGGDIGAMGEQGTAGGVGCAWSF
jgi:hypothetical protein